ncbi:hypothetical protein ACTXT7_007499 [Hymenolepis weldensis]
MGHNTAMNAEVFKSIFYTITDIRNTPSQLREFDNCAYHFYVKVISSKLYFESSFGDISRTMKRGTSISADASNQPIGMKADTSAMEIYSLMPCKTNRCKDVY